jgi:hypothetical protein
MVALNGVIRDAYDPYLPIIKSIRKSKKPFDISYLHPEVVHIAKHRLLGKSNIPRSLFVLSRFLKARYEVPCIVLIDEYDTPYDTAYQYGYYEKAQPIIGQLLTLLLKVLLLSHTRYSIFYFYFIG